MEDYYIFGVVILLVLVGYFYNKNIGRNSPYMKIKKKLNDELMQASFANDWKERQEINLKLIWLGTIRDINMRDIFGRQKEESSEMEVLNKLSVNDIKFPIKWNLDDDVSYPFSQEIISAYGKVLAENKYKGMYKPDNILPVPKDTIRKAIHFTFDYFNLKNPRYIVPDKDKRVDNLNVLSLLLQTTFIDTGGEDLPKETAENCLAGDQFKKRQLHYDEVEELKLIDWGDENYWLKRGTVYSGKGYYQHAFFCYNKLKEINPDNDDYPAVMGINYILMAKEQLKNGEIEIARENMRKAASYRISEAIEWLENNKATSSNQQRLFDKMGTRIRVSKPDNKSEGEK